MKRVHDLRPADLDRVPVWRYEGDDDEVAVVHATARNHLSGNDTDVFIARTQFALANGAQHVGFCSPEESLRGQWQRLGVTSESVFPIHFRCTVPVDGRYVTGTIEPDDLTGAA